MATLLHSESTRLYSWWWDSHNSPKNSKWLQENLTDMDTKVKSMIKLIEEDADSFARRAEMYYKKRPELMKLVEEFYRAYRALAERYNHATGELRHAHRTIAKAFPDQLPLELVEDSPSKSLSQDRDPQTPEKKFPGRALFGADVLLEDGQDLSDSDIHALKKSGPYKESSEGCMKKRGLKQFHDMFGAKVGLSNSAERKVGKGVKQENEREECCHDEVLTLSNENRDLKDKILLETERAAKAESEVLGLKKAIDDMHAAKEDVLLQYQRCLELLSNIEAELSNAQKDSMRSGEKAGRAEIEVQTLKEELVQLEEDKNSGLIKIKEYLEKISELESMVSQVQEKMQGLDERAVDAETEAQTLKNEISRLELEKEEVCRQYKLCLVKISDLEIIISTMEDEAGLLKEQAKRAEMEVSELKKALDDLKMEKEASAFQYKCCLETISKLEKDVSSAKEDVKRLNNEVLIGTSKLKNAEAKCTLLEASNQSLLVEADNLSKMIAVKDRELSEKQEEMEKLQTCLENEHVHHEQIEATLQSLQNLHSQSQDDQRAMAVELQDLFQMVKALEVSKNGLEEEIRQARVENQTLSQTNFASAVSMENMQNEIGSLREIKKRLEEEVSHHMGLSTSLQQEISCLKDEIKGLNTKYQALIEQVEAAGLNPKCLGTSIMSLQDDNSKLRQICEEGSKEREILSKKLENLEELLKQKVVIESSLSDLKSDLETSRGTAKALQESCQSLHGEKAALAAEKACLLSQLQSITENMHKLLERNAILDNSLSSAKIELEGLREKSKGLEEICDLLKSERLYLLTERSSLALKLENVEWKLEGMEKRYMGLEQKYADVEKEKDAMHGKVVELMFSLGMEKQERTSSQLQSETRLAGLENQIQLLQQDNRWKKKEFEEELEKALKAQFEISILQKFMKDMEEKNYALITECQKHVEASKLAEKLISELESESLEQQVESELLLDEIERLRLGIYQIFRALESGMDCAAKDDKVENERTFVRHILGRIEHLKCSISKNEDDKQQLLVENSVLVTLLEQLESKGMEIESQKLYLEKEFKIITEKLARVKNEKDQLLEMNRLLKSDANESHQRVAILEAELGTLCVKRADLCKDYDALQEKYLQVNQENKCLMKKFSELKEHKCQVDQHNDVVLLEFLATSNDSTVLRSFGSEKVMEVKLLLEDLNKQHEVNISLEKELSLLREKLELEKAESFLLKDAVHRLEMEIKGMRECSDQMKWDMLTDKENLLQTEAKLLDMELKLEAAENLNSNLYSTVDELRTDVQDSIQTRENLEKNMVQLSENNSIQKEEIESLRIVNANLKSELGVLREEIEEKIIREQSLSSELEEKNNEFELWEAEASAFYFDLQISSIHEVLFENKFRELTGVCQTLASERATKTSEIEQMKGEICLMKSEISGLKSQISAYAPVIASLKDDITLIENNAFLQTMFKKGNTEEPEFLESVAHPSRSEILLEDQTLLSLQNLQTRIKAVGKLMEELNKPTTHKRSNSNNKQESVLSIEQSKPRRSLGRDKHERSMKKDFATEITETPKLQKIKTKASEVRNGMLVKDIPLDQVRKRGNSEADDQMLELWETAEDGQTIGESLRMSYKMTDRDIVYDSFENAKHKFDLPLTDSDVEKELGVDKLELSARITEKNREVTNRKILERLASDHQKLESLQTTVQTLVRKLETNKTNKKSKNVDFETVNERLLEADETVVQLVDLNGQLEKDIQECQSPDGKASLQLKEALKKRKKKVAEQARKGSERIGWLQLELQKIQYILLKMEDEKKNKARNKFFKSKTVVLRDFIYYGRKNSGKRKKGSLCGCFRPSTSRNGSSP